jgi:predicted nucleic acid-binding protein
VIVVDASALLEVLLATPRTGRIADRIFAPRETLHAPHVLDLEIAQVLRRFVLSRELSEERGAQALEDLLDLPLTRYAHEPLLVRV